MMKKDEDYAVGASVLFTVKKTPKKTRTFHLNPMKRRKKSLNQQESKQTIFSNPARPLDYRESDAPPTNSKTIMTVLCGPHTQGNKNRGNAVWALFISHY
ncbi:hypothetical protein GDO86_010408 [Hymenochirus boettgeri]|uniref:Uncharacterized protein n=1 Tax=Hymenochirus boettgeri TaxID=247094 RepID=A0A8T2JTB4_9PIPI|nr:hypothetical protein GDO86_010408 [Hymenochirus boettgeri]